MFKSAYRRFKFGLVASALLLGGYAALAQSGVINTSPVVVSGSFDYNGGPQTSVVRASGGTFTCTSGGVIPVVNTAVTANTVFLFGTKTAATPGAFAVTSVTVGSGFSVTCATNDTSVYNYFIMG